LSQLPELFLNNLLPVFVVAGAGYLLGKVTSIEPRSLSQATFFIFGPCLVFSLITGSQMEGADIARMIGFTVFIILLVGGLTWLVGKAIKLERRLLMAVILATMFMNAGNYGLSVNLFAFGEEALAHASLFFVTSAVMSYTVGVVIASMGSASLKRSFLTLFKLPVVYALILGVLTMVLGWNLPQPLERTVNLVGAASIPVMLVLLGLQVGRLEWFANYPALGLANGMRLVIAPALAILFSGIFGLEGPARQAGILEAGMPTAVLAVILSTEFDLEPSFMTSAVFTSTFLSPLTLTPLLAYLGA
jgi:malate permease and related proteins